MLKITTIAVFAVVSLGIWLHVYMRRLWGLPVVPFARRRPAPWLGQDVLFIFLLAYFILIIASSLAGRLAGGEPVRESVEQKVQSEHPAERLLREGDWRAIAVAVFVAVIVAPIFEEFMFRVLLQGWLEARWSRRRRRHPALRRPPWSWLPVVLPAAIFAVIHVRLGRAPQSPQFLTAMFLGQIAASLATFGVAIVVLRLGAGATAADLGWQPRKLPGDAKLALVALLAAAPPLLLLQFDLHEALNWAGMTIAPDPIPLFFLALVFGVLYQRTHRIAPSLFMHMAFNATSIVLFFVNK
jgi:membrane protease YdiL (CAAX protease family)